MNKKERFQAVREKRAPDKIPVWPRVMAQMIYGMGWRMPDVTGVDWYDSEKITQAVLTSIKNIGYDLGIPAVVDHAFGVPALGGVINIPDKFGLACGPTGKQPVMTQDDWPRVKEKIAAFDYQKDDARVKASLEVIKNVSKEVGKDMTLVTHGYVGSAIVILLLRPSGAIFEDMTERPDWLDDLCSVGTDWTIGLLRSQWQAGANGPAFISACLGGMESPAMAERYNLPAVIKVVEMARKEFNQGVWVHLHGNYKGPRAYQYVVKLVKEGKVEGLHFDEIHPPEWVKQQVVDKLGVPACIITDGALISNGPIDKIRDEVKSLTSRIGDGLGICMAPGCQVIPPTPNENFKAWVDATHEFGTYPIKS